MFKESVLVKIGMAILVLPLWVGNRTRSRAIKILCLLLAMPWVCTFGLIGGIFLAVGMAYDSCKEYIERGY